MSGAPGNPRVTQASPGSYELVTLLARSLRNLIDELHERMAVAGFDDVRPAHGFAFSRLAPDGATGQELAEHLGVTRSAASQMIDELEERGYVRRRPHPSDRRGKLVVLTGKGWACIHAAEAILGDLQASWRDTIGEHRLGQFMDILRQVTAQAPPPPGRGLRPIW